MREILFKAKRKNNGEWVEGTPVFYKDGSMTLIDVNEYKSVGYHILNNGYLDRNTLCQYTGLTDKNGNKIWENDIVDASTGWWNASGPAGHDSPIIKVEWNEGFCGFVPFADYDCDCCVYIESDDVEVIGNIFDNPELLGGQ